MSYGPTICRVVVMGVTGVGKTEVGSLLATVMSVPYADGDSFHSASAIEKMSAGKPLDDRDREPWLASIGNWLGQEEAGAVVSCSALRRRYRDGLRTSARDVFFLHLAANQNVVGRRLAGRSGHFMPASLIESQFRELEGLGDDELGQTVDAATPADEIVRALLEVISGTATRSTG